MYINPYEITNSKKGSWLKANFHTHAGTGRNTCGAYEINDVIELYKEAGYDVLTISNHDLLSDISAYAKKFNMVMSNSFEYTTDPHMLCIGVHEVITGEHGDVINQCKNQGGFIILCHPHWIREDYWTLDSLDQLSGYTGIEIYNGVIFRLEGTGLATDVWDYLLSRGRLVWGFGNDDFHRWYDLARAYNMIYSPQKDYRAVQTSIQNGSFYVSTGMELNQFESSQEFIRISANAANKHVKNNKYIFIGKNGDVLSEQYGEYGLYKIRGDEMYIRVQVISEHGAMLWTQPVFDEALFKRI